MVQGSAPEGDGEAVPACDAAAGPGIDGPGGGEMASLLELLVVLLAAFGLVCLAWLAFGKLVLPWGRRGRGPRPGWTPGQRQRPGADGVRPAVAAPDPACGGARWSSMTAA